MWNWIRKLEEFQKAEEPFVLVTVTKSRGSSPRDAGAKVIVLSDGTFFGTVGGGRLEKLILSEARTCLADGTSRCVEYNLRRDAGMPCGGSVEVFMEVLNRKPKVYVFGGGHVGQAVCRTLAGTPFAVHVIDEREDWIGADRFPQDTVPHHIRPDDFIKEVEWNASSTYVVILTHDSQLDQNILASVIAHPAHYIGMIGSRTKWHEVQKILVAGGAHPDDLARVRCPMGIAGIRGKSPQEIAISVAAELLRVFYEE